MISYKDAYERAHITTWRAFAEAISFNVDKQRTLVWGLGARIGYWPCICGIFAQVHIGPTRITAWLAPKGE